MATNALKQIDNINHCLQWIKNHRPEQYEQKFLDLVGLRRKLRTLNEAEREQPAIAAYGESQKGKSYLIGNLLKNKNNPFKIDDGHGNLIDFVERINPIGDNKEATGVVTRFTSFAKDGNRYQKDHPILVKLFSVGSLATILSDSYFMDLLDTKYYSDKELQSITDSIHLRYHEQPELPQSILTADDILDIKAYLEKNVKSTDGLVRSGYFETLALVIQRVPQNDWADVLKYLWHENSVITNLFQRLLNALRQLEFAREVYVDIDAVMHLGNNKNTVMSVDCLNGLDDQQWSLNTDVHLLRDKAFSTIANFPKCELCALCAEVLVRISDDYLTMVQKYIDPEKQSQYLYGQPGYMTEQSGAKLSQSVTMNILSKTDLLDFPGARNRLKVKEDFLTIIDSAAGASNLVQMFLRGKVAYLFNHYSESRILNMLLFCHDSVQPSVNEMYLLIEDWVNKYVGDTPEKRSKTTVRSGNVPPLFVICTKFNMDMIEKHEEDGDSEAGLNGRWKGRFNKVLYTQSFKAESVEWLKNWDRTGSTFKNTYLLRDFNYSGCDSKGNHLYAGYDKTANNPKEEKLKLSPDFYRRLRDTFVNHEDVKKFFADPELSWDVAATINNDGALYIIEKMGVVANNIERTRGEQFADDMNAIRQRVITIMKDYYVTDDTKELLLDSIKKANGIFREMEFACQSNPDYFGHLLQALQLNESACYKELHRLIPELTSTIFNQSKIKDYELIRKRCGDFEDCKTEEEKWKRLIERYRFFDKEDAASFLASKKVDPRKLFQSEFLKRKNSAVISDDLLSLWKSAITNVQFANHFSGNNGVDEIVLTNLVTGLVSTANSIRLTERIEKEIAEYVNIFNTSSINEDLVADMIATTISDFVMDFGYRYLSTEEVKSARRIAQENHLLAFNWIDRERKEHFDDDEMTALFNQILSSEGQFTPAYDANYNNWLEYMYIAFIAHLNVPEYDHEANDALKVVLDALNQ